MVFKRGKIGVRVQLLLLDKSQGSMHHGIIPLGLLQGLEAMCLPRT